MKLDIKEKDRYKDLIKIENQRARKQLACEILIMTLAIFGTIAVAEVINYFLNKIDLEKLKFNLSPGQCATILIAMILIILGTLIYTKAHDKYNADKFLNELYKYLPLDREDINRNGLVDYIDYILCIHKIVCEINNKIPSVSIHERVRHDVLEVMIGVYMLDEEVANIINSYMEELVFKCDTRIKIMKLIDYYKKESELEKEYELLQL